MLEAMRAEIPFGPMVFEASCPARGHAFTVPEVLFAKITDDERDARRTLCRSAGLTHFPRP